jgi:hypothetical protein
MGWFGIGDSDEENRREELEDQQRGERSFSEYWSSNDFDKLLKKMELNPNALGSILPQLQQKQASIGSMPSMWAKMMEGKLGLEQQRALDKLQQSQGAAAAQAQSGQAMRGGLAGGTGAALEKEAMKARMAGQQGVRSTGLEQKFNIGAQDYRNQADQTGLWAQIAAKEQANKNQLLVENQRNRAQVLASGMSGYSQMNA